MKQSSYSRDFATVADTDEDRDTCIPIFRLEPEEFLDNEGVKQWRDREIVTIIMPGNSLSKPDHYVSDVHRKRWPKAYAAFKAGQEMPVNGTALESWPRMTKSMILKLKSLGFRTIEDVARMHQQAINEIGAGAMGLKMAAQAYIDDTARLAITEKAIAESEALKSRCSELEGHNKRLNEQLNLINERLRYMEMNQQFAQQNVASTPQQNFPQAVAPQPAQSFASPFSGFVQDMEARQNERRAELQAFKGPQEPPHPEAGEVDLQIPARKRPGRKTNAERAALAAQGA